MADYNGLKTVMVGILAFLFTPRVQGGPINQKVSSPEVTVSTMIYYTTELKNVVTDPILYIEKIVGESNNVFGNSRVPLRLQVHCIQELDIGEDTDSKNRLSEFFFANANQSLGYNGDPREEVILAQERLLNSADTAILITATESEYSSGEAKLGPTLITGAPPVAWSVGVPLLYGVKSFTHEVGHLFGCLHDRAQALLEGTEMVGNETGYGYLVEGTRYYTTMAYPTQSNDVWIPYFSSKDLTYEGLPIGDAENDNRVKLIQNRFLVSQVGDEAGTCSTTVKSSCAGMCLSSGSGTAPFNLAIHDREILCRDYCKLPSTGYYNLNGQAVGIYDIVEEEEEIEYEIEEEVEEEIEEEIEDDEDDEDDDDISDTIAVAFVVAGVVFIVIVLAQSCWMFVKIVMLVILILKRLSRKYQNIPFHIRIHQA